jgi:two-component system OmpR family sensor kinase
LFRSPRAALPARAVLGFSDVLLNGAWFRVYSVQTPYQTVQIAQDMGARQARARALALRAALPMAIIAPLLMLLLWWAIRRAFDPLERTRQQVAARQAEDLSPLPERGLPDEVRPLVQELNLLFARVHTAFDAQKSFVANAAHELRSPLTALKLQTQALERAQTEGERSQAFARLQQGVDRSIRLMNQLLVLARQEGTSQQGNASQRVDLLPLLQQALADALPQATERAVHLALQPSVPAWVEGDPDALNILLRNLLDNAIKYTPANGHVEVQVTAQPAATGRQALLTVEDSGPGISEAERAQVFERFYRSQDASATAGGSGLGLAIVQAIAQRHKAQITLGTSPRLGGLRVQVTLPALD